jgi:hypothetical protein
VVSGKSWTWSLVTTLQTSSWYIRNWKIWRTDAWLLKFVFDIFFATSLCPL